jgi:hypothetical protein
VQGFPVQFGVGYRSCSQVFIFFLSSKSCPLIYPCSFCTVRVILIPDSKNQYQIKPRPRLRFATQFHSHKLKSSLRVSNHPVAHTTRTCYILCAYAVQTMYCAGRPVRFGVGSCAVKLTIFFFFWYNLFRSLVPVLCTVVNFLPHPTAKKCQLKLPLS